MISQDSDDAMRALAKALAPYLADELRGFADHGESARPEPKYDDHTLARYVEGLNRDVIDRAIELFSALTEPPHRIDSLKLAERVGATSPRDLAGILTTPLKRRADALGLPRPWIADEVRGRSVWRQDDHELAARMLGALEHASEQARTGDPSHAEAGSHTEEARPIPSAVFVWSPESMRNLSPAKRDSACLRTTRPGSRAVIYASEVDQGIKALFDVTGYPQPHTNWRWSVEGTFQLLPEPIRREELLASPDLRPVFGSIMGRRRLPLAAQRALAELLAARLPENALPLFNVESTKNPS
jgi:hypothetical protein